MPPMYGHGHHTMATPLLPVWLRIVWAVALGVVALLHATHAWSMLGQRRWWHIGHTVMAAGMLLMYVLPPMTYPGLYRTGLVIFSLLTLALVITTVVVGQRERTLNPLWVATTIDMMVMTYMLLPTSSAVVSWIFVAYLACQALAWATGVWSRLPRLQPAVPVPAMTHSPATVPVPTGPLAAAGSELIATSTVRLTGHCDLTVRAGLVVMAAAMAYMLAVM